MEGLTALYRVTLDEKSAVGRSVEAIQPSITFKNNTFDNLSINAGFICVGR